MVADNPRAMTPPRFIVPGRLHFLTIRTVCRMFKLVPQREVVRVFEYLFAVSAQRFGMQIHEALCMSNHFHALVTDVEGLLPKFVEYLDMLLARSLNAMRGESGSVFEKGYGQIEVTSDEKALEHAVYILANPCEADLVRRSRHWPGFSTLKMKYGESVVFERPKVGLWRRAAERAERKRKRTRNAKREAYRGKPSTMPERIEFRLERPPVHDELSDIELRAQVLAGLDARELMFIVARGERGADVLGVKKVLAQPWYGFPGRKEDMFGTEPGVSGRRKWARIEALQRRKEFREAYAAARAKFVAGIRDVVWPYGTWLMRVRLALPCGTAPP